MHNFKKIVLAFIILLAFEWAACFLLCPVTYKDYLEKDIKKMEAAGETPQLVFVGDSSIYRAFDPAVFEENMEDVECAINIGTGSQSIRGSYFYLKDMVERYHPKYAVVGISHTCFIEETQYSTFSELTVIDRIKTPTVFLESVYNLLQPKDYVYLLKSYRYRDSYDSIIQNVSDKLDPAIRQGIDTREPEHYAYRGFVHTSTGFEEGGVGIDDWGLYQWTDSERKQESFDYLDKIVELCQEEDIQLFLVTGVTSLADVYMIEDYEGFVDCFKEYGEQHGVIYQDLNLLRDREILLPDTMLNDRHHLNGMGAAAISSLYCDILKENIKGEDTSSWFYSSTGELKQDCTDVIACDFWTEKQENGNYIIYAVSIQSDDIVPEYEFLLSDDNGETWETLQEYGEISQYELAKERLEVPVLIRINCRGRESTKAYEAFQEKGKDIRME